MTARPPSLDCGQLAEQAFERMVALHPLTHYTGILALQGLTHLAVARQEERLFALCRQHLLPFVRGERQFSFCLFPNYRCGGNATALLLWQGRLPEAATAVQRYAEQLLHEAPRDADGIFADPQPPAGRIWIDVAFAVTPFLLFAGLALDNDAYLEEAFQQTRKMVTVLRDPANGLLHQARNFIAPGRITEDHWSRGNGWAMLALAELVDHLPATDRRRPETERLFCDLVEACLRYQDAEGLWHQEMTLPTAYTETSGSGLILYGLGVGLAKGLLPSHHRDHFQRGLRGYRHYIEANGAVRNTCVGCRAAGQGTIADYLARPTATDDCHAFGPVTLAFGVAGRLGIESIALEEGVTR